MVSIPSFPSAFTPDDHIPEFLEALEDFGFGLADSLLSYPGFENLLHSIPFDNLLCCFPPNTLSDFSLSMLVHVVTDETVLEVLADEELVPSFVDLLANRLGKVVGLERDNVPVPSRQLSSSSNSMVPTQSAPQTNTVPTYSAEIHSASPSTGSEINLNSVFNSQQTSQYTTHHMVTSSGLLAPNETPPIYSSIAHGNDPAIRPLSTAVKINYKPNIGAAQHSPKLGSQPNALDGRNYFSGRKCQCGNHERGTHHGSTPYLRRAPHCTIDSTLTASVFIPDHSATLSSLTSYRSPHLIQGSTSLFIKDASDLIPVAELPDTEPSRSAIQSDSVINPHQASQYISNPQRGIHCNRPSYTQRAPHFTLRSTLFPSASIPEQSANPSSPVPCHSPHSIQDSESLAVKNTSDLASPADNKHERTGQGRVNKSVDREESLSAINCTKTIPCTVATDHLESLRFYSHGSYPPCLSHVNCVDYAQVVSPDHSCNSAISSLPVAAPWHFDNRFSGSSESATTNVGSTLLVSESSTAFEEPDTDRWDRDWSSEELFSSGSEDEDQSLSHDSSLYHDKLVDGSHLELGLEQPKDDGSQSEHLYDLPYDSNGGSNYGLGHGSNNEDNFTLEVGNVEYDGETSQRWDESQLPSDDSIHLELDELGGDILFLEPGDELIWPLDEEDPVYNGNVEQGYHSDDGASQHSDIWNHFNDEEPPFDYGNNSSLELDNQTSQHSDERQIPLEDATYLEVDKQGDAVLSGEESAECDDEASQHSDEWGIPPDEQSNHGYESPSEDDKCYEDEVENGFGDPYEDNQLFSDDDGASQRSDEWGNFFEQDADETVEDGDGFQSEDDVEQYECGSNDEESYHCLALVSQHFPRSLWLLQLPKDLRNLHSPKQHLPGSEALMFQSPLCNVISTHLPYLVAITAFETFLQATGVLFNQTLQLSRHFVTPLEGTDVIVDYREHILLPVEHDETNSDIWEDIEVTHDAMDELFGVGSTSVFNSPSQEFSTSITQDRHSTVGLTSHNEQYEGSNSRDLTIPNSLDERRSVEPYAYDESQFNDSEHDTCQGHLALIPPSFPLALQYLQLPKTRNQFQPWTTGSSPPHDIVNPKPTIVVLTELEVRVSEAIRSFSDGSGIPKPRQPKEPQRTTENIALLVCSGPSTSGSFNGPNSSPILQILCSFPYPLQLRRLPNSSSFNPSVTPMSTTFTLDDKQRGKLLETYWYNCHAIPTSTPMTPTTFNPIPLAIFYESIGSVELFEPTSLEFEADPQVLYLGNDLGLNRRRTSFQRNVRMRHASLMLVATHPESHHYLVSAPPNSVVTNISYPGYQPSVWVMMLIREYPIDSHSPTSLTLSQPTIIQAIAVMIRAGFGVLFEKRSRRSGQHRVGYSFDLNRIPFVASVVHDQLSSDSVSPTVLDKSHFSLVSNRTSECWSKDAPCVTVPNSVASYSFSVSLSAKIHVAQHSHIPLVDSSQDSSCRNSGDFQQETNQQRMNLSPPHTIFSPNLHPTILSWSSGCFRPHEPKVFRNDAMLKALYWREDTGGSRGVTRGRHIGGVQLLAPSSAYLSVHPAHRSASDPTPRTGRSLQWPLLYIAQLAQDTQKPSLISFLDTPPISDCSTVVAKTCIFHIAQHNAGLRVRIGTVELRKREEQQGQNGTVLRRKNWRLKGGVKILPPLLFVAHFFIVSPPFSLLPHSNIVCRGFSPTSELPPRRVDGVRSSCSPHISSRPSCLFPSGSLARSFTKRPSRSIMTSPNPAPALGRILKTISLDVREGRPVRNPRVSDVPPTTPPLFICTSKMLTWVPSTVSLSGIWDMPSSKWNPHVMDGSSSDTQSNPQSELSNAAVEKNSRVVGTSTLLTPILWLILETISLNSYERCLVSTPQTWDITPLHLSLTRLGAARTLETLVFGVELMIRAYATTTQIHQHDRKGEAGEGNIRCSPNPSNRPHLNRPCRFESSLPPASPFANVVVLIRVAHLQLDLGLLHANPEPLPFMRMVADHDSPLHSSRKDNGVLYSSRNRWSPSTNANVKYGQEDSNPKGKLAPKHNVVHRGDPTYPHPTSPSSSIDSSVRSQDDLLCERSKNSSRTPIHYNGSRTVLSPRNNLQGLDFFLDITPFIELSHVNEIDSCSEHLETQDNALTALLRLSCFETYHQYQRPVRGNHSVQRIQRVANPKHGLEHLLLSDVLTHSLLQALGSSGCRRVHLSSKLEVWIGVLAWPAVEHRVGMVTTRDGVVSVNWSTSESKGASSTFLTTTPYLSKQTHNSSPSVPADPTAFITVGYGRVESDTPCTSGRSSPPINLIVPYDGQPNDNLGDDDLPNPSFPYPTVSGQVVRIHIELGCIRKCRELPPASPSHLVGTHSIPIPQGSSQSALRKVSIGSCELCANNEHNDQSSCLLTPYDSTLMPKSIVISVTLSDYSNWAFLTVHKPGDIGWMVTKQLDDRKKENNNVPATFIQSDSLHLPVNGTESAIFLIPITPSFDCTTHPPWIVIRRTLLKWTLSVDHCVGHLHCRSRNPSVALELQFGENVARVLWNPLIQRLSKQLPSIDVPGFANPTQPLFLDNPFFVGSSVLFIRRNITLRTLPAIYTTQYRGTRGKFHWDVPSSTPLPTSFYNCLALKPFYSLFETHGLLMVEVGRQEGKAYVMETQTWCIMIKVHFVGFHATSGPVHYQQLFIAPPEILAQGSRPKNGQSGSPGMVFQDYKPERVRAQHMSHWETTHALTSAF